MSEAKQYGFIRRLLHRVVRTEAKQPMAIVARSHDHPIADIHVHLNGRIIRFELPSEERAAEVYDSLFDHEHR